MPILTNKPASVSADSTTSLTLNKADLQAKLAALSASAYWQDQNTWKGVAFLYQNADQQNVTVSFDATGNTANLTVSEYFVNGNIECKRIDVFGFANDYYTIFRKDFTSASESDIQITGGYSSGGGGGGGGGISSIWDTYLDGHILEADGGIYGPTSGGSPNAFVYASGNPIPANTNGEFTFILNNLSGTPPDFCIGIGPANTSNSGSSTYFGMGLDPITTNQIKQLRNNSLNGNPEIFGVNLSGQVTVRIAREGSDYKLYIDNVLKVTAPVNDLAGHSVSNILVPAVRTKGNVINTGVISASRTI